MTKDNLDGDVAFIKALAELLKANELTELEVTRAYGQDDSLNVRVSRAGLDVGRAGGGENVGALLAALNAAQSSAPAPAAAAAQVQQAPAPASTASGGNEDPASHPGAVTSPMVGTAYLQSEPGAPAFVAQGQTVKEGDTILIIEAMKTMNQIPAPRSGKVTRILVDDGAPVEYGAPLMIIE
ncbi:MAG: acetyl-CoA carboxylase biotin carboxyl carrier protein [Pseudomonadota bacterium]